MWVSKIIRGTHTWTLSCCTLLLLHVQSSTRSSLIGWSRVVTWPATFLSTLPTGGATLWPRWPMWPVTVHFTMEKVKLSMFATQIYYLSLEIFLTIIPLLFSSLWISFYKVCISIQIFTNVAFRSKFYLSNPYLLLLRFYIDINIIITEFWIVLQDALIYINVVFECSILPHSEDQSVKKTF